MDEATPMTLVSEFDAFMAEITDTLTTISAKEYTGNNEIVRRISSFSGRAVSLVNELMACNDIKRMTLLSDKLKEAITLAETERNKVKEEIGKLHQGKKGINKYKSNRGIGFY